MCIWIFFLFVCSYCFRENRIGSLCLFVLKSISAMSFIPNQVKQCLQQFAQFNTGRQKKNRLVHTIEDSNFFNSIAYYNSFVNPADTSLSTLIFKHLIFIYFTKKASIKKQLSVILQHLQLRMAEQNVN